MYKAAAYMSPLLVDGLQAQKEETIFYYLVYVFIIIPTF